MKHAFLIIAHNEYPVLEVLLSMLDDEGSPDKPGGLSIQLCKSEKKEFYIRYSS